MISTATLNWALTLHGLGSDFYSNTDFDFDFNFDSDFGSWIDFNLCENFDFDTDFDFDSNFDYYLDMVVNLNFYFNFDKDIGIWLWFWLWRGLGLCLWLLPELWHLPIIINHCQSLKSTVINNEQLSSINNHWQSSTYLCNHSISIITLHNKSKSFRRYLNGNSRF
jgi:hypothetical protein